MAFQTVTTPARSAFRGNPVSTAPSVTRRTARTQMRARALGIADSLEAMKTAATIGFLWGAIPGAAKGMRDLKRVMAEPNPPKPWTAARQQVFVFNETALLGSAGATAGLCVNILIDQLGLAPGAAWPAGTVGGLALWAAAVGLVKRSMPADLTNVGKSLDEDKSDDVAEAAGEQSTCSSDEDLCELPDDFEEVDVNRGYASGDASDGEESHTGA